MALTYLFNGGTSWVVPPNVLSIQVDCYGSSPAQSYSTVSQLNINNGGAFSRSTNINVTPGQTVYFSISTSGGDTWFNSVSNLNPITGGYNTSQGTLAKGGSTSPSTQTTLGLGDLKYAGGNGYYSATTTTKSTGQGGQAGPNGNGADAGPAYTNSGTYASQFGTGGGANGGSSGGLNTIPTGRGGSTTVGNGGYSSSIYSGSLTGFPTIDTLGSTDYVNNIACSIPYGPVGGGWGFSASICCVIKYAQIVQLGFIVVTVTSQTTNNRVIIKQDGSGSFTLPSDFSSIVSLEALGAGGAPNTYFNYYGGNGAGAYSKTTSSLTVSASPGTTVYYNADTRSNQGSSWIRVGTAGPPTSATDGVKAESGKVASSATGVSGGLSSNGIGDVLYSGGSGGNGNSSSNWGGNGGAAGAAGKGGSGGASYSGASGKGGGGSGGANNGSNGGAGTLTAGGAGGACNATGGGTGGAGATSSTSYFAGTNGGGTGGTFNSGFSTTALNSVFSDGIRSYGSGYGNRSYYSAYQPVSSGWNVRNVIPDVTQFSTGAAGGSNPALCCGPPNETAMSNGGWVILTYNAVVSTTGAKFLQFF